MKNKKKKLLLSTTLGGTNLLKISKTSGLWQPAYGIDMPQPIKTPIYETIILVLGKILHYILVPIFLIIGCYKYVKSTKEPNQAKIIACIISLVLSGFIIFLQVKSEEYNYFYSILHSAITICYIIISIIYLIKKGIEKFLNVLLMPTAILTIIIGIKYLGIYMLPILILLATIIMVIIGYLNKK